MLNTILEVKPGTKYIIFRHRGSNTSTEQIEKAFEDTGAGYAVVDTDIDVNFVGVEDFLPAPGQQ